MSCEKEISVRSENRIVIIKFFIFDFFTNILTINMNTHQTAKDIASNRLFYIDGLATVKEAIDMMKKNDTDVLIIAKRDEKDANGIVVISDIIKGVIYSKNFQ